MYRLTVKHLSKVQIFLWNYDTANSAIFGDKQMLGHSVLQTPALVFVSFHFKVKRRLQGLYRAPEDHQALLFD